MHILVAVIYKVYQPSRIWAIISDSMKESVMIIAASALFSFTLSSLYITPPVGLNLYVINGIAPEISLPTILKGALPFMLCMVIAIIILCIFPEIITWFPSYVMGAGI